MLNGSANNGISTDGDLLVSGCPKLITKIDFVNEIADIICIEPEDDVSWGALSQHILGVEWVQSCKKLLSHLYIVLLSIFCVNDFNVGLKGVGWKCAVSLLKISMNENISVALNIVVSNLKYNGFHGDLCEGDAIDYVR